MAGKRFQGDHGCCRDRADGSCALAMVRRLSEERVRDLAEDIWTASTGRAVPATPFRMRTSRAIQVAAETRAFPGRAGCRSVRRATDQDGTGVLLPEPDGRGHVVTAGQEGSPGRTPHGSLPADR